MRPLLASKFLEPCEPWTILGRHHPADLLQGGEPPVIDLTARLANINERAHQGLDHPTAVDGIFQLGTSAGSSGLAHYVALDIMAQIGVLGVQAD